jgi:HEAT repeat protein
LKDYDTLMSLITIESLVKLGEMALPPLVAALKGGDWWVRRSVVEALRQIGTPEALAAVREYEDRQC